LKEEKKNERLKVERRGKNSSWRQLQAASAAKPTTKSAICRCFRNG
jgi:hypothetical protein